MVIPISLVAMVGAILLLFALYSWLRNWSACSWVSTTLVIVLGVFSALTYYEVPEDHLALSKNSIVLTSGHYIILNQECELVSSKGKIVFEAAGVMRIEYDFHVTDSDIDVFASHHQDIVSAGSTEQFIMERIGPALIEYVVSRDVEALESFLEVFRTEYGVTLENGNLSIILQQ